MSGTEVVADGFAFPECPRWRDGRLWFSDQHDRAVLRLDPSGGASEKVVEVPGQPSGLGWLADDSLLVVSMVDRRVMRLTEGRLEEHADLSAVATFHCNDMVVDWEGRAYVGNFGFDFEAGAAPVLAALALVHPDGRVEVAARDLSFPNGAAVTRDGETLVVAESSAARVSAFDIAEDGTLVNRRVFAQLEGAVPDGICLDAEGAVWIASPIGNKVLRVLHGGKVTHQVDVSPQNAYACVLGGSDRRTLFVCTAPTHASQETTRLHGGRIEAVEAPVPGAGIP